MANLLGVSLAYRIPFHDVDAMRICWHGNYYKYFEMARTELLRRLQIDLFETAENGIALPVIRSQCKYISPLRFDQNILIQASIVDYEYKLVLQYVILDADTSTVCAKGSTEHAAVDSHAFTTILPFPAKIANIIRNAVENG